MKGCQKTSMGINWYINSISLYELFFYYTFKMYKIDFFDI